MKAVDLLSYLSNKENSIGQFAIVKNSFVDYSDYGHWFEGTVLHRLGINSMRDINIVYQCRGYKKINKYIQNSKSESVILYGYCVNYRKSPEGIVYLEKTLLPEMANEHHQLIKVETYKTLPTDDGYFFESGIIVELIK